MALENTVYIMGLIVGLLYIGAAIYFKAFTEGEHDWRHIIVLLFVGAIALFFVHSSNGLLADHRISITKLLAFTGAIVMWLEYVLVLSGIRQPVEPSLTTTTPPDTDTGADEHRDDD